MTPEKIELLFDAFTSARAHLEIVEQALRAAFGPQRPARPIQNQPARILLQTDWPKIGGRGLVPAPTALFASPGFQALWAPSGSTRAIYAGACHGLGRLARRLQMPLYKIATTDSLRQWLRMKELRSVGYGAVFHDGQRYVAEDGWKNWYPSRMEAHALPSPMSPVVLTSHAILVPLPQGMTPEEFDEQFDAATREGAIGRWLLTPEGRNHCAALGVDPAVGMRLTDYPGGQSSRLAPAGEICGFSCLGAGPDRAIAIAETILLRKLGLID